LLLWSSPGVTGLQAWSAQGHRLVALVATPYLTNVARLNVARLLDDASLADVAVWADAYVVDNRQTGSWHYVNVPPGATGYDRDRDCPTQPGALAGSRADRWRDCVVDRIEYNRERLANASLDRADRAIALKFLVHLVGDLHQPFHALNVARGGNDIPIVAFGSSTCTYSDGATYPCNLHGVWDTALIAHRGLSDGQYLDELVRQIDAHGWDKLATGSAAEWAMESHAVATKALLPSQGVVDEAYYRTYISRVDERVALGGLRLAALLNQTLATAYPSPKSRPAQ
jgi:S1/P1 Nuclease